MSEKTKKVQDNYCTLCSKVILRGRLATRFKENGVEKNAHDSCLGNIDSDRMRKVTILD